MIIDQLTVRQRLTWFAHLWKACTKQHHTELAPLFAKHLADDAVVFDVGAHSGQFAKLFAGLVPRGRVYSFEPGSYARSILTRSMKFSGKTNVTVMPFGLGSKLDSFELNVPIKKSGSLGFGLSFVGDPSQAERPVVSETVHIRTIDDVAHEHDLSRLDFIKVDIEGFELEMLKGGQAAIKRFRPAMYIEVYDAHLRRAGGSAAELLALLEQMNYRHTDMVTGEAVPPENLADGNLFFVARG